jgi:hypothetical protein
MDFIRGDEMNAHAETIYLGALTGSGQKGAKAARVGPHQHDVTILSLHAVENAAIGQSIWHSNWYVLL